MRRGARVVIEDVTTSPVFAGTPALDVLLAAGVRAVQSTPLVGRSGQLVGMLSAHYRAPRRPLDRDLRVLDLLARQAADWIERTQAEEALRESEGRFRGTFENAAVGIAHRGLGGRFLRVNEKFCAIVGYSREELLDQNFQGITYPEDLATELQLHASLLRGESASYTLEKRYVRKDGSPVWVALSVSVQRDAADRPAYIIAVAEDVSERKQAEEALRVANARLDLAVRSSNIGIWEVDMPDGIRLHGRFTAINFWEQLGYDPIGSPIDIPASMAAVHPDDLERTNRAVEAYLSGDTKECDVENRLLHKDGSYRRMLTRGVAVRDATGKPVRLIGAAGWRHGGGRPAPGGGAGPLQPGQSRDPGPARCGGGRVRVLSDHPRKLRALARLTGGPGGGTPWPSPGFAPQSPRGGQGGVPGKWRSGELGLSQGASTGPPTSCGPVASSPTGRDGVANSLSAPPLGPLPLPGWAKPLGPCALNG
jgi:PAS domain S-box-containing protein